MENTITPIRDEITPSPTQPTHNKEQLPLFGNPPPQPTGYLTCCLSSKQPAATPPTAPPQTHHIHPTHPAEITFLNALINQISQYRPTWFLPTGLYKKYRMNRLCKKIKRNQDKAPEILTHMILQELRYCCTQEIDQRKYQRESRSASPFVPYRTYLGRIFNDFFPNEVRLIEASTKARFNEQLRRRYQHR